MQNDLIAVTEADREQAAAVIDTYEGKERYAVLVRAGNRDGHPLCLAFARHRQQVEDAMRQLAGDLLRKAIEGGYPTPARKTDQCEHGKFGWEDCIACYDEQLLNTEAAIRAAALSKEVE